MTQTFASLGTSTSPVAAGWDPPGPSESPRRLRGLTADGGGPTNTPAIALGRVLGAEQESKEPLRVVVPRGVLLVRLVAGRLREALQEVFGPADLVRDERGAGA